MGRQILIIAIASVVMSQIAVFTTSIYLHRALAHRALTLKPFVEMLFRIALWLVTGGSRQEWVAVHRKHHTYTDREGDPHSPLLLGFWKVHILHHAAEHPIIGQWALTELRRHGYDISPGTLYPLLKRMERNGWLRSEIAIGNGPRRRARCESWD